MNFSGIILAGGKSSRMGSDKGLLELKGKSLIEHAIDTLKNLTTELIISANHSEYIKLGYPVVKDTYLNCGPMSGLLEGLNLSHNDDCLLITCDAPFVNKEVFEVLISEYSKGQILYSETSDGIHPLIGIYPTNCVDRIEKCLESGTYKMTELLDHFPSKKIYFGDEYKKAFANINTLQDLNQWK